jgi:SAM-dependent methyltransferase
LSHEVTGVDISEEQIARARSNVPAATFIRGDVREVKLPVGAFDAIVALYLIDNIARADFPALFRRFGELLRPNGRLLLSAEPGEDPWQQYTWLGVPMLINTVPTQELVQLLEEAGLSVVSSEFESQLEGGRPIEYAWIIAVRLRSPGVRGEGVGGDPRPLRDRRRGRRGHVGKGQRRRPRVRDLA